MDHVLGSVMDFSSRVRASTDAVVRRIRSVGFRYVTISGPHRPKEPHSHGAMGCFSQPLCQVHPHFLHSKAAMSSLRGPPGALEAKQLENSCVSTTLLLRASTY